MFSIGVESLLRVGAVVDYLQLARLVVVTVPGTQARLKTDMQTLLD